MKSLSIEEIKQMEIDDWLYLKRTEPYDNRERYYSIKIKNINSVVFGCGEGGYLAFSYDDYGKTWLAYKNKEQAECKGELVELPRIIHPNELEWFVQYQYPSGIINDEIFYSLEKAEQKLKELRGKV